jgi:YfiH family protein
MVGSFPQYHHDGFARIPLSPESGLSAGLTLRSAGDMAFTPELDSPARLSLYRRLGVSPERVAGVRQIHSRIVFRVSSRRETAGLEGDGLVTGNPQLVLGVTVADCLPVFLYTLDGAVFGVVHSGWKGTGIAAEAVRLIGAEFGIPPDRIGAALGPCIGPCCYDVPEDRAELFSREWGDDSVRRADGKWYLDLARANVSLLEREGVSRIVAADACTSCTDALGSFRREGPQRFTRMLALIGRF